MPFSSTSIQEEEKENIFFCVPRRSVKQFDTKICLCHKNAIRLKLNVKTFRFLKRLFIIILSLFYPCTAVFIFSFGSNFQWILTSLFLFSAFLSFPLISLSYFSVFFSWLLGEFPDLLFQLSNAILNVFILLPHRIIYFKNITFHVQYFYL